MVDRIIITLTFTDPVVKGDIVLIKRGNLVTNDESALSNVSELAPLILRSSSLFVVIEEGDLSLLNLTVSDVSHEH